MSLKRRKELIEYALAARIPILEDNPYSRLRFRGEEVPTLFRIAHDEYSNTDIVTEVVSFSKILGPGLRWRSLKAMPSSSKNVFLAAKGEYRAG